MTPLVERDNAPWILALVLGVLMLVAWEVGTRVGSRHAERAGGSSTRIDEAILALLGLLLAFTFAGASEKHERRKELAVTEATAIGDLGGAIAMLDGAERDALQRDLRDYADVRIAASRIPIGDERLEPLHLQARGFQAVITRNVATAIAHNAPPGVQTQLIATLNATTTSYEARLFAAKDNVPPAVLLMLAVTAVIAAFALGRMDGLARRREPGQAALFVVLVTLVVEVTLDLEQPRRGMVTVPVTALESVRETLSIDGEATR